MCEDIYSSEAQNVLSLIETAKQESRRSKPGGGV